MDYKKVASDIIEYVGGKENIKSMTHCFTRLRFGLLSDGCQPGRAHRRRRRPGQDQPTEFLHRGLRPGGKQGRGLGGL